MKSVFGRLLQPGAPEYPYHLVAALFLRLLALIYLAAFASLVPQIAGLAGPDGILPLGAELGAVRDEPGLRAWFRYPTLFWLDAGDHALQGAALAGCALSVTLLLNLLPRLSLVLLWTLYLSLYHAGQLFMNFQWDYLLLEAGFLAIFLRGSPPIVIFLFRWLLFRLRFLSGLSKLLSQDPAWTGLTALAYYFQVQPLPHAGAWYAHQLPEWLLQTGVVTTLVVEILVPLMMFLPRRFRLFAAWATIGLQVLILLTSNHNFFNLLTIALCLFLFDDQALRRVLPRAVTGYLERERASVPRSAPSAPVLAGVAAVVLASSSVQAWEMVAGQPGPEPLAEAVRQVRAFRLTSNYHVFPTMKTERIELEIEGSRDGEDWRTYRFRYRPGDVGAAPRFAVPHQPRLDWLMWFVPLGPPFLPWFERFLQRLLDGAPAVTALLDTNPFPGTPPRYLRVNVYRYRFTDPATRARTGHWWQREYLGPFYPLPWLERTPRKRGTAEP